MRRIVWALTLCVLATGMPLARASHPTTMCLDLDPDQQTIPMNDLGSGGPLWAYPGVTDAEHPPQYEGCGSEATGHYQDWGGTNIDFEFTGAGDVDASDSPSTPDQTCTVVEGGTGCSISPQGPGGGGVQTIRAWIDTDLNGATVEADTSEGYDEVTEPGTTPEPDATDVAQWIWEGIHGDPIEHETALTIAYRRRAGIFRGAVLSEGPCVIDRPVRLDKRVGGMWVVKGRTQTDSDGRWRLEGYGRARGRYRAVASRLRVEAENTNCLRGRSPHLRVP